MCFVTFDIFQSILRSSDSAGRDLINKVHIMGYSLAGGNYDVIQDGPGNVEFSKKNEQAKIEPFQCVLAHAYIKCILLT